jgi:hypothetical protein
MTLLGLFLAGYIAVILAWENFTYGDNSIFTLVTLRGHDIGPPIWPQIGRFFPLGYQEFNLIRHFTDTITGYHAFRIAQLLIFSWVLLILDDELSINARVAILFLALITPSIHSFSGLIYHEANVLLCIVCLALFVKRFEQTHAVVWAVAAVLCAQIMLYYKEIASLFLLAFAVSRLVLRWRNTAERSWDYSRLWDRESRLDLCLIFLAVLFLLYYLGVMLPHPTMRYVDEIRQPLTDLIITYMKVDLLALLFVGVVLFRTYLIARRKVAPSLLWDGLAFAGTACFFGYLVLGISAAAKHYSGPIDLVALLYLGHLTLSTTKLQFWHKPIALALLVVIMLQDFWLTAFGLFAQKSVVYAKGEIAQVIQARYQNAGVRRLFFPFARPYWIMEFASYLDYQGIPVEGLTDAADGVSVVSGAMTKDGPCVNYRDLICHAAAKPSAGDLVIVLPDDNQSLADLTPYLAGEPLFSYEPIIPQWALSFIKKLPLAASPDNTQPEFRDGWLHASVTVWK